MLMTRWRSIYSHIHIFTKFISSCRIYALTPIIIGMRY